eukprot:8448131-Alexandrium_andersonii.AAC.1
MIRGRTSGCRRSSFSGNALSTIPLKLGLLGTHASVCSSARVPSIHVLRAEHARFGHVSRMLADP